MRIDGGFATPVDSDVRCAAAVARAARWAVALALAVTVAGTAAAGVVGDGTPGSCTQAALATQIAAGGTVTFNCGGAATIFVNMTIPATNPTTVIDGGGLITFDGSHANAPIVWIQGSAATLPNITFKNLRLANGLFTTGRQEGGAIWNQGTATLDTVALVSNRAMSGGAIAQFACAACLAPSLTVTNSRFSGNESVASGGAIYAAGGSLTIDGSTFSGNSVGAGSGGAIYLAGNWSVASISGSTFAGNRANSGAGMAVLESSSGSSLAIVSSTFTDDCATTANSGSALLLERGNAQTTLSNLTIAENGGTGLHVLFGLVPIRNSIVANNHANCDFNVASLGPGIGSNLQYGDSSCTGFASGDPRLGALAANGGATLTMLPGPGSAAIDATPLAACTASVDQRGLPRPWPAGGACDIGAVELQAASSGQLAFVQQPTDAMAGATITPAVTVRVEDGGGVAQPGVPVTLALASGSGTLSGTTTRTTDASGVATFDDLSIELAGTKTLSAARAGASGASASFSVSAGAATSLRIGGGTSQSAIVGTEFASPLWVLLTDAFGNPVGGTMVTFAAPASGASATLPGTMTTNADGRAFATATANGVAGSYDVTASVPGLPPVSFALTNTAPARLAFSQQPTDATAGAIIAPPVEVQLQDAGGNPVAQPGVSVSVALASGSGTLSGTTIGTTGASGVVTFANLSIDLAGTKTLAAASTGLTGATSASFVISAPDATSLAIVSGSPQTTTVGTGFAVPLEVLLTDAQGDPISGAVVTFAAPTVGASATLTGNPATTDATGHAQVTAIANGTAGSYAVTATVASSASLPLVASFALTNTAVSDVPALGLPGLATLALMLATLGGWLAARRN